MTERLPRRSGAGGNSAAYIPSFVAQVAGDGATDDGPAINTALTRASAAGGGQVVIPAGSTGVAIVGTLVVIPSNCTLTLGHGVTLRRKTGFSGNLIQNNAVGAGGRDTNVGLILGVASVIDGGDNSGASLGNGQHHVFFRHVDRLTVRGDAASVMTNTAGKYAVSVGDCTKFDVGGWTFTTTASDGVHVTGPAQFGRIHDLWGNTGDDFVGVTTQDYSAYDDVHGVITDLTVERVSCTPVGTSVPNTVALWGSGGYALSRIQVRDAYAANNSSSNPQAVIVGGTTDGISLDKIYGQIAITYQQGPSWNGLGSHGVIRITNSRYIQANNNPGITVTADGVGTYACTVRRLEINGYVQDGAAHTGAGITVSAGAVVTECTVDNAEHFASNSGPLLYCFGTNSKITYAIMRNCYREGVDYTNGRLLNVDTSGTITNALLAGCVIKHGQWAINSSGAAGMTLSITDCDLSDCSNSIRSAVILTDCRVSSTLMADVVTVSAGTIRSRGFDLTCDVSKLAKNVGDYATNTSNANTGTLGVGPVVCTGTGSPGWKSLVSGNTF